MSPRRMRSRLLDLAVATVCVACVAAPLLPVVQAADGPAPAVVESGGSVDQKVLETGMISNPLNGSFDSATSGTANGSLQWDVYSTASGGMKLLVSSDRSPAMRDSANGKDIADYGASLGAWSVSGDNRFGFTASGPMTLDRFDDGSKWRGLDGTRGVEVARRAGPIGNVRTTLRLRAEYAAGLGSGAKPTANLIATAVPNFS